MHEHQLCRCGLCLQTAEKVKKTAVAVKSETKKAVNKAAQKAPKAKKALKRMVSEIDAQAASKAAFCNLNDSHNGYAFQHMC